MKFAQFEEEVFHPLFSAVVGVMMLVALATMALGCTEVGALECEPESQEDVQAEPEDKPIVKIRADRTLVRDPGRISAICGPDQHVVRGWCYASDPAAKTASNIDEDFNQPAFDKVRLGNRMSNHSYDKDGWMCAGEPEEGVLIRLTAFVECEAGGGMRE